MTHRSGTSIGGEHPARSGTRKLKRALFLSTFATLHDPPAEPTTTENARKVRNNAALIRFARRRCDVLFAMLKTKTLYQSPATQTA